MTAGRAQTAALGNATRALEISGYTGSNVNIIDFVTITTLGNAQDFGDDTGVRSGGRGFSNTTRGVFGGGYNPTPYSDEINYLTIASTGNAVEFGSLSSGSRYGSAECSVTRGIFNIGESAPSSLLNTIEYVNISTQGDTVDFGDLPQTGYASAACSNGHGGL